MSRLKQLLSALKLARTIPQLLPKFQGSMGQWMTLLLVGLVMYFTGLSMWASVDVIIENMEMFQLLAP